MAEANTPAGSAGAARPGKKSSLVFAANSIGLSLLLMLSISALLKYVGGYFVGLLLAQVEQTADLVLNLYRILSGLLTFLPPYLLLKSLGRRVKLEIPLGSGKIALWLLLSLFVGLMVCGNAITSLLKNLLMNALSIEAAGETLLPEGMLGLVLYFVAACVVPAILEELYFRGAVQGLLQRWGARFAILVTAALFSLMHGSLWELPMVFLLGLALGYVRYVSGSVTTCIVLHFANNTSMFIIQLVNQRMSGVSAFAFSFWIILILVAVFVAAVWVIRAGGLWPALRVERDWPTAPGKPTRMKRLSSAGVFIVSLVCLLAFFIVQIIW